MVLDVPHAENRRHWKMTFAYISYLHIGRWLLIDFTFRPPSTLCELLRSLGYGRPFDPRLPSLMILTVGGIKGGSGVAKIEIEGKAVSSIEEEAGVKAWTIQRWKRDEKCDLFGGSAHEDRPIGRRLAVHHAQGSDRKIRRHPPAGKDRQQRPPRGRVPEGNLPPLGAGPDENHRGNRKG